MAIKEFNRAICKTVAAEIEVALQTIADFHHIVIKTGGGKFDYHTYALTLNLSTVGKDGKVHTREADDFPTFCKMFNLDAADLGKSFHDRGRVYTVTGLKPGNPKYPVMVTRDDGKKFKYPASRVIIGLHPDRDPKGSFGQTMTP